MFKQRLATALILGPLVLLLLCYAPPVMAMALVLVLLLVCGLEWVNLIPIQNRLMQIVYVICLFLTLWIMQYKFGYWLMLGLLLWGLIFVAIGSFPASKSLWGYHWIVSFSGLIVLPLFVESLSRIYQQNHGIMLILTLLLLVWATDIGAYLTGKKWGKHKLIPKVSPGKTLEGLLGGFLLALIVGLIIYYHFKPFSFELWLLAVITTIIISTMGDLFISMLKRRVNLKDTGQLLPGHGGILDRIDSLIAATPFYYGILFLLPGYQL